MSTKLKLQLIIGLVVLIFAGLVIYQNRELLTYGFPLVFFSWQTQKIPNAVYLLAFFILGAVGVFVLNLRTTFRLKSQLNSLQDEPACNNAQAPAAAQEAPAEEPPSA